MIYENNHFSKTFPFKKYSIRSWIYDFLGTICLIDKDLTFFKANNRAEGDILL